MESDSEALPAPHAPVQSTPASRGRPAAATASSSSSSDSSSDSSDSSDSGDERSEPEALQPVTDAREISVELAGLNESLTCKLCRGYFREAHTIMDCLHIFCRSCLERHIVSTRRNDVVLCPIKGCFTKMIATHPIRNECRFDRVMQNLVDKLLPRFAAADEELKQKIAAAHGKGDAAVKRTGSSGVPAEAAESAAKRQKFGDDKFGHEKLMIFELRPYVPPPSSSSAVSSSADASSAPAAAASLKPLDFPFVKTSAKVTVKYLRRFITERLGLNPASTHLDVQCSGEVLATDHTIEFVWRTRWHHLHPNQHLVLTYRLQAHVL